MRLFVKAALERVGGGFEVAGHFAEHALGGRLAAAQEFGNRLGGPIVLVGQRVQADALPGAQVGNVADQAAKRHGLLDAEETALRGREIDPGAALAPAAQVKTDLLGVAAHLLNGFDERELAGKADATPGRGAGVLAKKAQMPAPVESAVAGQKAHVRILAEAA